MFLPNKGIAFLFIAIASNIPSHNITGIFQFIKYSLGIISLDTEGFLYFVKGFFRYLNLRIKIVLGNFF